MADSIERTLVSPLTEAAHKIKFPDHWERYEFASKYVRGKQVLDVACGPGYGTSLLSDISGVKAIGIDVDPTTITESSKNYGHKASFLLADGYNWRIESQSIDIIVSLETFEHLDNPDAFMKEAYRVLKTEGMVIMSTPINETDSRFSPTNPFHIREYSWVEFGQYFSKYFIIQERFSQISKTAAISQAIKTNRMSFIKRLVPKIVRQALVDLLNNAGMKKGQFEIGFKEYAGVQVIVGKKL